MFSVDQFVPRAQVTTPDYRELRSKATELRLVANAIASAEVPALHKVIAHMGEHFVVETENGVSASSTRLHGGIDLTYQRVL